MKRRVGFAAAGLLALAGVAAWSLRTSETIPSPEQRAEDRLTPPAADAPPAEHAVYEKKVADIAAGRDPLAPAAGQPVDSALKLRMDERRATAMKRAEELRAQALERLKKLKERQAKDPNRPAPKPPASLPDLGPAVVEEKP